MCGEALGRRRFPLGWAIRCVVWSSVAGLVSGLLQVNFNFVWDSREIIRASLITKGSTWGFEAVFFRNIRFQINMTR